MVWIWVIEGALTLGVVAAIGLSLASVWRGAPFVVTQPERLAAMFAFARQTDAKYIIDLGSGDGEVLIAFARAGFVCVGYEINPLLVWRSQRRIKAAGLEKQITIRRASFWRVSLQDDIQNVESQRALVVLYGVPRIMAQLARKLQQELKPGTPVISNAFALPGWKSDGHQENVYFYRVPPEKV